MLIASPSRTSASGPPTAASGDTCPTTNPWLPPEKRPSVISATWSPSPLPMMAAVGLSISRMPGPAARTLVAHDDHVAGTNRAVEDRLQRRLLAVEHPRAPGEPQAFLAGDLGHRAFRRQVAVQHDQVALGLDRVGQRPDDLLPGGIRLHAAQVLRQRLAGDRQAVAVQQAACSSTFISGWMPPMRISSDIE